MGNIMGEGRKGTCMKGYMDKAQGGRIEGGRWRWMGWVGSGEGKLETTVLEKQLRK